jgi:hypothetical protein
MKQATKYDTVLQELRSEFNVLMHSYLEKLCNALYEDDGEEISYKYIVKRIRRDCVSICSDKLETITFDEMTEELVFKEVIEERTVEAKRTEFCPDCGEETISVVGQDVPTSK